ncbi:hypothetical protein ISG08_25905 [Burkholderia pseudomallei]|nr:hypothetical protein [Burkholderia pseudomallei]
MASRDRLNLGTAVQPLTLRSRNMNAGSKRFQHVASSKSSGNAETASNSRTKGSARFKPKALVVAMSVSGLLFGYQGEVFAELTAISSEPTPATDQGNLASGFNAAVTEARSLVFNQTNYTRLWNENPSWATNNWPDGKTLSCPNPNTNPTLSPGYLASLYDRCAYYSRDYVHQATGAYYLGLYDENYTMANKFATTYHENGGVNAPWWAISVIGKPYEQRDELPAPFELGENIANMYRLTADNRYLGQDFQNYISQMTSYVKANSTVGSTTGTSLNPDGFRMARTQNGETASYNEFLPDNMQLLLGGDLAASQIAYYRAIKDNPTLIAKALSDNPSLRSTYFSDNYRNLASKFDQNWYITSTTSNPSTTCASPYSPPSAFSPFIPHFAVGQVGTPGTFYSSNSNPNYSSLTYDDAYIREPNIFPLYKNIITDSSKMDNQARYIDQLEEANYVCANKQLDKPGIEYHTYLPTSFYNASMPDKAWKWLTRLAKWQSSSTKRDSQGNIIGYNAYPEVSFVLISDTITKVLGLDYDAPNSVLSTKSGLPSSFAPGNYVTIKNIPIYNKAKNTTINVDVTQKINSNGATQTDLAFVTDLSTVAFNQGFHWAPKFYNPTGNQYCKITRTYRNGGSDNTFVNVMTDSTTKISTCQDGTNIGIWVYTGQGANISSYSATLSSTNQ